MMLLDLDGERAAAVADRARRRQGHAPTPSTPVPSESSPSRLQDVDVLVNTASYRINLDAMQACLGAGCHYLDLGGPVLDDRAASGSSGPSSSAPGCWRCWGSARARARPT